MLGVIGQLINETGCRTIIVNGVEDQIHCFFGLNPSVFISEVMQVAKGKSCKYINDHQLPPNRFEWQDGYSAFFYSHSHIEKVYHYIENQEERHHKDTFKEEYKNMLTKYAIPYDGRSMFDPLI